ncbi:hypothetical protein BDZ89DRAFT_1048070 [Hymenopellis radicata]|nr:hypothetical protein BDZ89DRAFT_1048070 [Hymenopellis radicata]
MSKENYSPSSPNRRSHFGKGFALSRLIVSPPPPSPDSLFLDPALSGLAIAIRRRMAIAIGSSLSVWRTQHLGFWSAGREVAAACAAGSVMLRNSLPDLIIFAAVAAPVIQFLFLLSGTLEDCTVVWVVLPSAADAPATEESDSADVPTTDRSLSLLRMPSSFEVSRPSSPTSRSLTDLAFPQSLQYACSKTPLSSGVSRLPVPTSRPLTDLNCFEPSRQSLEDSAVIWGIPLAGPDFPPTIISLLTIIYVQFRNKSFSLYPAFEAIALFEWTPQELGDCQFCLSGDSDVRPLCGAWSAYPCLKDGKQKSSNFKQMPPRVKKCVVAKKAATKVAATKKKNQTSDADDSDGEDLPTTSRRTCQMGKAPPAPTAATGRKRAGSASVVAIGTAKKRQRRKSAPKKPEVPEPVPEDEGGTSVYPEQR